MTKQKISSKVVRARSLAVYELEKLFEYIRTIDPELEPDQAIVLTAYMLSDLPKLIEQNPTLVDRIKEIATNIKLKNRTPNN
ncbi:hypothetical protein CDG76_20760 [Nostoc sp. 'Peltigera membranacea cyanobiont' 210A]|uniref:hypothetical protein n=1 Tax=Nostoc sp. 'Peltigera membranacea cyanobiont' 210A TaxID=2014529 RepID=UPI000B95C040|nr:hypothetical protein [Nostoc sp. 'Peltigera membranacea cyanobiont' 210A]OYD93127.1 hypothetical protein CDG76_20760 [Nostoc sp. 'Peltigera membranacea cyanobiont' 210A]